MNAEIAKGPKACLNEISRSVDYINETIKSEKQQKPQEIDGKIFGTPKKKITIIRKPLGVVLVIAPFNYPVNLAITKLAPALLTGNTVVYKSATNGTVTSAFLTELAVRAGFPSGVFNFVTGPGHAIGNALVSNSQINAIMFTGGTKTGLSLAHHNKLARLILELGGNDVAIVCEDADLQKTVDAVVKGAFAYSGQRCTAIKRVLVARNIHKVFIHALVKKVNSLTVGFSADNADITPLINHKAVVYVTTLIRQAISAGATAHTNVQHRKNLVWPVVLDDVSPQMSVWEEEQFGPVLPVMPVDSDELAVSYANSSKYGLQASVFTTSPVRAQRIAKALQVGTVNVNGPSQRGPDQLPFLGVKESGHTTQGVSYALRSVTREFTIVTNN